MQTITQHAEVRAVLADPSFVVPRVPEGGEPGSIGWLRASVARFSTGAAHRRRRSLGMVELAGVDAAALWGRAFERTASALQDTEGQPVDVMARVVPVELLAEALGVTAGVAEAVAVVAAAYHPHADAGPAADRAVARLVDACGGVADEVTAARIALLVQACDATAGLVGNAVPAMLRSEPHDPIEAILAETLCHDPPVRATRRLATVAARVGDAEIAAGALVEVDLAAAARQGRDSGIAFGSGPHACPGRDHALAIAGGMVEAFRGSRPADPIQR